MDRKVVHVKQAPREIKPVLILDTGKPRRRNAKLTVEKRRIVLESLLDEFDLSRAAAKVGVAYNSLAELIKRDAAFAASVKQVEDAWMQNLVHISMKVASQSSHVGATDRWNLLRAHLPEKYAPKGELKLDHRVTVTAETARPEMRRILTKFNMLKGRDEIEPTEPVEAAWN